MSDETVVEADGITASKFFNAEDFPVPAVAFDVTSSRNQPVTLRIVDDIPDEFGIDQIGFHPEYGSEHWTASGDGVVQFERDVDPDESFTTVYGVRMEEGQDETPFLSAPTVEVVGDGEDEDIDEVVPPESTSVVRELAGGERETVPGLEDDAEIEAEIESGADDDLDSLADDAEILGGDEEPAEETPAEPEPDLESELEPELESEPEPQTAVAGGGPDESPGGESSVSPEPDDSASTADVTETDSDITGEPGSASEQSEPTAETVADLDAGTPAVADEPAEIESEPEPAADGFDASDVVGALADAIREDEVSQDDLETLQSAFGGVPNSTQVEIDHLQSRVSELTAYTDALEEFIDEEGTAQELVTGIESDVEKLTAELENVESSVEHAAEDREDIRARIAGVEEGFDAVDDLENDLDRLRGDLEALDERVADTEELAFDVNDLVDDVEDLEEHVEEIEEWRNQLSDVFGT